MDQFYSAISLFRRKKSDECISICNEILHKNSDHKGAWELKMRAMTQRVYVDDIEADDGISGKRKHEYNLTTHSNNRWHYTNYVLPIMRFELQWLSLSSICRMRTTIENDEFDMNRLATAPRPGTTLRTETSTASAMYQMSSNRPKTLSGRPLSGMVL